MTPPTRFWIYPLAWMALLAGCAPERRDPPGVARDPFQQARDDDALIANVRDAAIINAIIAQHTIYPYHFTPDAASLNDLGHRDLTVLAEHYRAIPGDLSVRRGAEAATLYDARVHYVADALARAGVDMTRVRLVDAPPGGAGMSSQAVQNALRGDERGGRTSSQPPTEKSQQQTSAPETN